MPSQMVGTPAAMVTLLVGHELEERLGVQVRPREDELRPRSQARIREPPGVRVEEGDDREHGVAVAEAEHVARADRERVERRRAMRVEDPLGPPRRAARVAKDRRRSLVEGTGSREVVLLGRRGSLRSRGTRPRQSGAARRALAEDDDVRKRRDLCAELPEKRDERLIDQDHAVFGVPGDVREIVAREAQVQRVQHGAHRRDRAVRFEVARVVPAERGHAVAALHAEPLERGGEARGAREHFAVRRAVEGAVRAARDDLGVTVKCVRARA